MVLVATLTVLAAAPAIGARATYGARTTADEPQYLMTALSLGEDFDLDISDEISEERFRPFHEVSLNPQTLELNSSGQRLSPHDPLLPLILALPMRLGGWALAKAAMVAIAAATAVATLWLAVRRFGVSPSVGAAVVGGLFVSPPLVSYATQIYPEMPAALCVVAAVAALTGSLDRRAQVLALISIVALPWLAVKYTPVTALLGVTLLTKLWPRERLVAAAHLAAVAAAGAAYLAIHQRIYGGWTVYASGDHFIDGQLQVIGQDPNYLGRSRRLIGLLVDSGFGLAAWTPAFLLLPAATVALVRNRVRSSMLLAAAIAAGWLVATWVALTMHGWWWPGRQLVVVLPLSAVVIAIAVERIRLLLAPVILGCVLGAVSWFWLVVEASTNRRTLVVDFDQTANPWYRAWSTLLPDYRQFDTRAATLSWIWVGILALSAVAVRRRATVEERATANGVSCEG